jgi:hypothetical protein
MSKPCNSIEMAVAKTIVKDMPACCRIAFAIGLLNNVVKEAERDCGSMDEIGLVKGPEDIDTAISFLQLVRRISDEDEPKTEIKA